MDWTRGDLIRITGRDGRATHVIVGDAEAVDGGGWRLGLIPDPTEEPPILEAEEPGR